MRIIFVSFGFKKYINNLIQRRVCNSCSMHINLKLLHAQRIVFLANYNIFKLFPSFQIDQKITISPQKSTVNLCCRVTQKSFISDSIIVLSVIYCIQSL